MEKVKQAKRDFDRQVEHTRRDFDRNVDSAKRFVEDQFKHEDPFEKGMRAIRAFAPDYWSVTVGPVTLNLHGYNEESQGAFLKLIREIQHGKWPGCLGNFLYEVRPLSLEIEVKVQTGVSLMQAGVKWVYEDPVQHASDIISVISNIN